MYVFNKAHTEDKYFYMFIELSVTLINKLYNIPIGNLRKTNYFVAIRIYVPILSREI